MLLHSNNLSNIATTSSNSLSISFPFFSFCGMKRNLPHNPFGFSGRLFSPDTRKLFPYNDFLKHFYHSRFYFLYVSQNSFRLETDFLLWSFILFFAFNIIVHNRLKYYFLS